jgi:hypothetical protein
MSRTSTIFQKSIRSVDSARVLKPGGNNGKLGRIVSKGRWKGKRMYSVTLVERETCPRSCHHWDDCYGNNMPFAHRFALEGLEDKIEKELDELCTKYKKGIVVRLHVLGDFYSVPYVLFWERMLLKYDNLSIFGYTAREQGTKIGNAIFIMNLRYPDRCVIRSSRNKKYNGLGEFSYAADESFEGESFDCPEQTGKANSCADCALCWQTKKTVRFATH